MEMFEELDNCGCYTGRTVSREDAHRDGNWHRAVLLFIVNDKNQVLMQKRSVHKKLWPGCWDGTGGGHVEAGDLGYCCAIKEMKEELNIDINESDIRYIGGYLSDNKKGDIHDRHINEFYVAHKNVDVKDVKLQESEVEQIKWIDFDVFKQWTTSRSPELTTKWEAFDSLVRYMERK